MPLIKDPLLIVWEAMNLLAEVDTCPDTPQIKRLLSDAEGILSHLAIELARRAKLQDLFEPQPSKLTVH
jgi:hypothetical protein